MNLLMGFTHPTNNFIFQAYRRQVYQKNKIIQGGATEKIDSEFILHAMDKRTFDIPFI